MPKQSLFRSRSTCVVGCRSPLPTGARATWPGLLVAACLLIGPGTAVGAEEPAHRLTTIGGASSFVDRPLESVDELRELFRDQRSVFVEVLRRAGWEGEAEHLFEEIARGGVEDSTVPVGGRLHWMAFRPRPGRGDVIEDVEWAGDGPLEVFRLAVESAGRRWTFAVPKACGNLALEGSRGLGELTLRLASGAIDLVGPDGRPIALRGGEVARIPASRITGEERGEAGTRARLVVDEGEVELSDPNEIVRLAVGAGEEASVGLDANRGLELEIPETNGAPLEVRIGDAVGTIAPGTGATVDWTPPECGLVLRPETVCAPGTLELDATGSSVADGELASVELSLEGPEGVRDGAVLAPPVPLIHRTDLPLAGAYRATAVAISDRGRRSTCETTLEVPRCRPDPPVCSIRTPDPVVEPFEPVRILGVDSSSRGGKIERIELEVLDAEGAVVASRDLARPFTDRWTFPDGGARTFRAVAIDDHGQRSTNVCRTSVEVLSRFVFTGQLAIGLARNPDAVDATSGLASVGLGLTAALGRDWQLSLEGRLAATEADGEDAVPGATLALDRRLGPSFFGVGLGVHDPGGADEPTVSLRSGAELGRLGGHRPARIHFDWTFPVDGIDGLDRFELTAGFRWFFD